MGVGRSNTVGCVPRGFEGIARILRADVVADCNICHHHKSGRGQNGRMANISLSTPATYASRNVGLSSLAGCTSRGIVNRSPL